nr:TIGR02300 family protein [Cereibacter sediminicola]
MAPQFCSRQPCKGITMPKEEWGTKRVCPTTGKRFYDLNRTPVVSPYTGEVVDIESARRKAVAAVISRVAPEKDDELLVDDIDGDDDLLDAEATEDTDVDDDLLEDDSDDNVSLDELADVAGDDEEG